jgi:hypothetical protein
VARGPISAFRRRTRRGAYRLAHAVVPEMVRLRLRPVIWSARREQRRAARWREKALHVELKGQAEARAAAKSRSSGL